MRRWPALLAALPLAALPAARGIAAEFRGTITCDVLPGYTARPMPSRLVVEAQGTALRYRHAVLDWQNIPMPDDHIEQGSGAIDGAAVRLDGHAPGNGDWSYDAHYQGTLRDGTMLLSGEQRWTGTGLAAGTPRRCQAELRLLP